MALSRITNYIEADGADLNLQSSDTTLQQVVFLVS